MTTGSWVGSSEVGDLTTSDRRMTRLEVGVVSMGFVSVVAAGGGTGLWQAGRGHIVYVGSAN